MRVTNFSYKKDYEYNLVYETVTEEKVLKTNDNPRDYFLKSLNAVVSSAIDYLQINLLITQVARLESIKFSVPGESGSKSSISLLVKNGNYTNYKCSAVGIPSGDESEKLKNIDPLFGKRNAYNEALRDFQNCCAEFIKGDREQRELPLEEEKETEVERDLFTEEED